VEDALEQAAEVREERAYLRFARGETPFGEKYLRVLGK
jgi:hypothetical protein